MLFVEDEFMLNGRRYQIMIGESDFGRHWANLHEWKTYQKRKKGKLRTISEWQTLLTMTQGTEEFDTLVPPDGGPWAPLIEHLKAFAAVHSESNDSN